MKIFLYSSVYSCHLFLISSASLKSISFLSFIVPIFAWNIPLVSLIFLKRSLIFPILMFSSISLHCSLWKAFSSLLAILLNSTFRWIYLSFSPLPFTFLCFSTICKALSDDHFAFLPLLDLIPWICLSLPLDNHKGVDSGHTWSEDGEALYSQVKQRPAAHCGSDHELLIAKFKLKLKKVGKPLDHSGMT